MTSLFVARQPIFDSGERLFAYELLYRRNAIVQRADVEDTPFMSADVIVGTFLGLGMDVLTGSAIGFVNFGRDQLVSDSWQLLERDRVVIELLETVACDAEVIAACKRLVGAGYRLALDDYIYDPQTQPLLDLASIVKLDVLGRTPDQLADIAAGFASVPVKLLAERVETSHVRDQCVALGFEYFQGYFYSKPETFTNQDVATGELATLRLLNLLQDPRASEADIEAAFATDLALCYKLLRMVNAAAVGGRGIQSIQHAIRLVGRQSLHRWVALLFVSSLGRGTDVNRELALNAITRARMCELLVRSGGGGRDPGSAFVAGMLSLIDVLLKVPMNQVLRQIDLSVEIEAALVGRKGAVAPPLILVEAYERGEWDVVRTIARSESIIEHQIPSMYFEALRWARERLALA
ncbi:MAG TPA: HDOD domain-containing protein [Gemmatimonadaceae bacterium]|nr:HDOD domain-containing protein [Gemmatimonadaceae bacterium]